MKKPKILIILGPTASGKSAFAVEIAREFGGEIVSADSRQVYRGLDIGAGKISRREMKGIPHHMIDVADPRKAFSVDIFKSLAEKAIDGIISRGRLPILCGGTGLYIRSVVDGIVLPEVPPNKKLRDSLSKLTAVKLFTKLAKMDPERAKTIDPKNPVRLIRAIEIATALGSVPKAKKNPAYKTLQIGIRPDSKSLREKIDKRLAARMKAGMVEEVRKLHESGLSWKRMESLGLEYRYMARFLQGKMTRPEMLERLEFEIWHYALRQMSWFRKDKRIHWIEQPAMKAVQSEIKRFLSARPSKNPRYEA